MTAEDNLQRMKTLDDSWNAQDWAVFRKAALGGHRGVLAGPAGTDTWSRCPPSRVGSVLQVHREPSGEQPVQGDVRLGRLDVHDREVEGKDDRTVARARRQSARSDG